MDYSSGMFWGIIVIVLGAAILLKHIFNLDFPVFKVVFGVALILVGLKILVFKGSNSDYQSSDKNKAFFGDKNMFYSIDNNEYNAVFSSSVLDLTKIEHSENPKIKVSCIFGSMRIIVNKQTKLIIDSDVVFGSITNPDENYVTDSNQIILKMKVGAIFSSIRIVRQ